MTARPLRILQVNTFHSIGGAAQTARSLFEKYRDRGHESWLAVGHDGSDEENVITIPQPGEGRLRRTVGKAVDFQLGIEDFRFPGTWQLLDLVPRMPDILHIHNLHGGYFDLRALADFSRRVPTVLTLHDAWLLSGHCAHSLECERWRIGCGHCPDLTLDPPVKRDATAYNWRRKHQIFEASTLHVASPSRWLLNKAGASMLATGTKEARVLPNGVDLSVFQPGDKQAVRASLGLPAASKVVLFAGHALETNMWKDFETVRSAVALTSAQLRDQTLVFVALGQEGGASEDRQPEIRSVPYQADPHVVARYYQAADVYMHAAFADTFPYTVIEALACGTPVVGTAVGGIPEQVDDGETGFLVPGGDADAMAARTAQLLADDQLQLRMSSRAAEVAQQRFDLERQVDEYLDWYGELAAQHMPSAIA
jgi:glycosyltransferase involved in cell wall biosynthesis